MAGKEGKGCQGGKSWDRSPQDPGDGAVVNDHMEGISVSLPRYHNHFHAEYPILSTEVLHQRPSASKGVGNCAGFWGGRGLAQGYVLLLPRCILAPPMVPKELVGAGLLGVMSDAL